MEIARPAPAPSPTPNGTAPAHPLPGVLPAALPPRTPLLHRLDAVDWLYALALVVALGYWWWMGGRGSAASSGVLAAVAMLCVAGIANHWIKLSLHMASLGFVALALLSLWPTAGVVGLLLMPVLGWSRVRMARHRLDEVIGGGLLGLATAAALRWLG